MSYGLTNPCWNCTKKDKCTDHVKILQGIQNIHDECISEESGHMGAGEIIILCHRIDAIDK